MRTQRNPATSLLVPGSWVLGPARYRHRLLPFGFILKILILAYTLALEVFATWCGPCQQIAPVYDSLSESLSHPKIFAFVKVDTEKNPDLTEQYKISVLPTFLLFQDGKVIKTMSGVNVTELKELVQKLEKQIKAEAEAKSAASSNVSWSGADIPRGYSDISDQVEIRNCELLNADEEAGPVKVLFDASEPTALVNGKGSAKDFVQSGSDDQLLLFIPFQGSVKLHTLQVGAFAMDTTCDR